MISWKEAQRQAKEHIKVVEQVDPVYNWVAYKNGKVAYTSTISADDAAKVGDTKLVEEIMVNGNEVAAYRKLAAELDQQAMDIWYTALREDYAFLSDSLFDICYSEAYDIGHAWGHDEVASRMCSVVDFAKRIVGAK